MKHFISTLVLLAASATPANAAQFHETTFYKETFSRLPLQAQNTTGLVWFASHIRENILKDHRNKTCEHRQDVDIDLVKLEFRRQTYGLQVYNAPIDGPIAKMKKLKKVVYENCYQKNAKVVNDDWTYSDVAAEASNDSDLLPWKENKIK